MMRHEKSHGAKGIFCLLIDAGTEGLILGKKEKKVQEIIVSVLVICMFSAGME